MAVAPLFLQDSSGQLWQVTATNAGQITVTPVPGSGSSSSFLQDLTTGQVWTVTILTSGMLHAAPTGGPPSATQLPIIAPNGIIYALQIDGSVPLGTSPLQVNRFISPQSLCPFSLGDADSALAARLEDSTGQFWTSAERVLYIKEAIRTWNALTGYFRGDFLIATSTGTQWYDLTNTTQVPNTLRPLTVTGTDLATIIEYHLLEPPVGAGPWIGSLQFNISDIQSAIQRRRNETIGITGCKLSRLLIQAISTRIVLPNTVIDVRRVAFIPADGSPTSVLWEDDSWALQAFQADYTVTPPGVPSTFVISTAPFLTVDVDIPPIPGKFELLVIESGFASSNDDTLGANVEIPDDWSWVIKWGALSDLFGREGYAKDELRREYCEGRYRQGLQLLEKCPAVLAARVNNIPLEIDAVKSADEFNTDWQAQAAGPTTSLLLSGLNLVAVAPISDSTPQSLTLTVIQNAPLPTTDTDCLLLDRSLFDIIVDYAQHLATLKIGGAEFAATQAHYTRFMQTAALYTSKYKEMGEYASTLLELSQREEQSNPRYRSGTGIDSE